MRLYDSHCHLDFPEFDRDREDILSQCQRQGITGIVVPGVTAPGWPRLIALCDQHRQLHPALGLHPMFLAEHRPEDIAELEEWVRRHGPVALGEIGLDFYLPGAEREQQQALFTAQLELARRCALPVILHVRKAHDVVLGCLRRHPVSGGIVHAFSGSAQQAQQYIELGFCLGFGGVLTYPNAKRIRHLAQELPLQSIVLETDAPDMPPLGWQGERNTPLNVSLVLEELAGLRQEANELIAEVTSRNLEKVLNIKIEPCN